MKNVMDQWFRVPYLVELAINFTFSHPDGPFSPYVPAYMFGPRA